MYATHELFERNGAKLEVKFYTREYGEFPLYTTREKFIEKLGSESENKRNILEAINYLEKEEVYHVKEIYLEKGMGPSRVHVIVSTYFRDFFITSNFSGNAGAEFWHDGKLIFAIGDGYSVHSW